MKAVILSIGTELVSGQTVDTNSAYLSRELAGLGVETIAHATVGDEQPAIAAAIREAAARAPLVLVTGGL
ncbi:MAG TPA: molybdopterin-binding protein, partial [Phycisphaerae bacterium]|nr:molybdopterin-binding protein [Phycisphaerae bacterium]